MRLSRTASILLLSMLVISVFLASFINLLSTKEVLATKPQKYTNNYGVIDDTSDNLIWFIQITDIHLSIFRDPGRVTDFKDFCRRTVEAVKPKVVLASGDLTDAKTKDSIGSQQFEKEWQYYRNTLNECRVKEKTTWLDIRGNHDNFNVAGLNSKQNFFTNYSIQGKSHKGSYMHQIRNGNDLYTFFAIDACLDTGPKRPFNFIGRLDQKEINEINELQDRVRETGSNHTIWFGHFPTSCILSSGRENIRELIGKDNNGLAYLCGHLHTLGGLVENMYTIQKEGFLELELGDWKDNRIFRILAVDHGILSFVDIKHGVWPVALVTNPKAALFYNPTKENIDSIRSSTHIRILAFSLNLIDFVKVKIGVNGHWEDCYHVKDSLWAAKWSPRKFSEGLHRMEVHVKDVLGRETFYVHSFSLDGTRHNFDVLPRFALMADASTFFRCIYFTVLVCSIAPLIALRIIDKLIDLNKLDRPQNLTNRNNFLIHWLRKFWILSSVDRLFWPLVLYPLYLTVGPWSIGYLIEDQLGVIFAWGIFVNGHFLPGSFTYIYGSQQLIMFQIPLTFMLAHAVDLRLQYILLRPGKKKSLLSKICVHLPFLLVYLVHVLFAFLFWLAYGTLAFILGPLRTWSLILALVLWYQALHLPKRCTKNAANIWYESKQIESDKIYQNDSDSRKE